MGHDRLRNNPQSSMRMTTATPEATSTHSRADLQRPDSLLLRRKKSPVRWFPVLALGILSPTLSAEAALWPPANLERLSGMEKPELPSLTALASAHLKTTFLRTAPPGTQLIPMRNTRDELGNSHLRYYATFQDIPVYGSEVIVHLDADQRVITTTDALVRQPMPDTLPLLDASEAIRLAQWENPSPAAYTAPAQTALLLYPTPEGVHLAWQVELTQLDGSDDTSMPMFFIDANTGDLLHQYDNLQTATGKGYSNYYGTNIAVETYYKSPSYYLEDLGRQLGAFDLRGGTSSVYRCSDSNNVFDQSSQKSCVDVHNGGKLFYDYLYKTFARKGLNGSNGPGYYTAMNGTTKLVTLISRYGSSYKNAAWVSTGYAIFGEGDGSVMSPLVSVDIVAHELTHGLIQYTANLSYSGEVGAVNEGLADIFGTLTELYAAGANTNIVADYWIGEDAWTPATPGDAMRYQDEPHKAANNGYTSNDDPDHYSERYTGTDNTVGIHTNAGIINKAFYLMVKGGSHSNGGSMTTTLGKDKTAQIFYSALVNYMTSTTNFSGARSATLKAAKAKYGNTSAEFQAVDKAWTLCGVTTPAANTI